MSSKTVATPTAKYTEYASEWEKCRDAIAGQRKIHEKGEEYLPKLSGQGTDDYNKYLRQALFYNATGRTFTGYKGLIFRKAPDINAETIQDFVDDCTLSGKSLSEFAELTVEEEMTTSRFGILVDHPSTEGSNLSQAEAEERGNRPYFVAYTAEDILDVKTERIGARTVLSQVRLKETVMEPTEDEFKDEKIQQIRVLDLEEVEEGVRYRQRVFRKQSADGKDGGKWEEVLDMRQYPRMNGAYITEIPFYMTGGYEFREPFLIDLVNVNLSHYVAYADHCRGVSWTTRPQPWATGVDEDDMSSEMVLGGGTLWRSKNENAEFGMLEYSGSGLTASENNLDRLEMMMAILGAIKLMSEDTPGPDTATEFVIRKEGEDSSLSNVSGICSQVLTQATQFAGQWMGVAAFEDIEVQLNTDFIPFEMSTEDMIRMWSLVQSGAPFTADDWLWNAKQGERLNPTIDDEERLSQMETNPPQGMSLNRNGV